MIKRKPTITELPLSEITVPADRLRVLSEAKIEALMRIIPDHGFRGQITVRRAANGTTLIAGAHRLEAMRRLGRDRIPVDAVECTLLEARQMEIEENLVSGMTPLQDAIFLAEWQNVYEELHPEAKQGVAGAWAKNGLQTKNSSFADLVAESRQITPRRVQQITAAVRRLSRDERNSLQDAPVRIPLDEIEKLGKIGEPEERAAVVRKLSLGAAKKVVAARRAYAEEIGAPAKPVETTDQAALKALFKAWERAPKSVLRQFVRDRFAELSPLVIDEAEVRDTAKANELRAMLFEEVAAK